MTAAAAAPPAFVVRQWLPHTKCCVDAQQGPRLPAQLQVCRGDQCHRAAPESGRADHRRPAGKRAGVGPDCQQVLARLGTTLSSHTTHPRSCGCSGVLCHASCNCTDAYSIANGTDCRVCVAQCPEGSTPLRSVAVAMDASLIVAANNKGNCFMWSPRGCVCP